MENKITIIILIWSAIYAICGIIGWINACRDNKKVETIKKITKKDGSGNIALRGLSPNWESEIEVEYVLRCNYKWSIFFIKQAALLVNGFAYWYFRYQYMLTILITVNSLGLICFEIANLNCRKNPFSTDKLAMNGSYIVKRGLELVSSIGVMINAIAVLSEVLNVAL